MYIDPKYNWFGMVVVLLMLHMAFTLALSSLIDVGVFVIHGIFMCAKVGSSLNILRIFLRVLRSFPIILNLSVIIRVRSFS